MINAFEGFASPVSNFFRMPNEWTDITAGINNLAELKVVEYVLRHTWGYQEFGVVKTISIDEFMYGRKRTDGTRMDRGTRLSEQSVRNGLERAISDGLLICETDDSDKARIKKSYSLKMQEGEVKDLDLQDQGPNSRGQKSIPQRSKSYTPEVKDLDPGVLKVRPRSEKETLERNQRNTPQKERETQAPTSSPDESSLSPSFQNSLLSSLTEEQSLLWQRWCVISQSDPNSLNQNAYKHVVELATRALTTDDLQSLYDAAYERIREFSQGGGKTPVPPRLGNLVKAYPEWSQGRVLKSRDQEQEQKSHAHIPGTGRLTNYTGIANGQAPVIARLPNEGTRKRPAASAGRIDFQDALEQLRQRRAAGGRENALPVGESLI